MTTAAKQESDAKAVFRRFTDSLLELLEHPETPSPVYNALVDAVSEISNETGAMDAPRDFDCGVLTRVFGLGAEGGATPEPAENPRGLPAETFDRLQALGSAIGDVLEDDRTPAWLHNSLIELSGDIDNRASSADPRGREAAFFRKMFAGLCEMADNEEGGGRDGEE